MSKDKERSVESEKQLPSKEYQTGFLTEVWQQARLLYKLFLDPEVPIYIKLLPIAAAAYLVFPFDFLPDVIPGLGQLDDLTILIVGAKMFIEMAPQHVVDRYLAEMRFGKTNLSLDEESGAAGSESAEQDIIDGIILEDDAAE